MKLLEKVLNTAIIISLMVCWLFFGTLFYWGILDRGIPSVTNFEAVSSNKVKPGDEITITYSVQRHRACNVKLERVLESLHPQSLTYLLSVGEREISEDDIGKQLDLSITLRLGLDIVPGDYVYYVKQTYACNPIQKYFPIHLSTPKVLIKVLPR